ncbi:DNA phosphorothioation-dependent restriction protein DptF [Neobacillus bataviensis]|uniref:DNA phosphorothioation-dependent restriction protein DptF n=1 Tax=Neobacillus bataviensis TaxID=220685 RepID=A0A561CLU3_9BACI|nr:DNA phosphorothioation-dependent restriction protein DptF [Neobacillus bataviensis]TWD92195.1 DNA phosphorothioation-dependent restriction protein DptF [Neobacillus bataviensis]
MNTQQNDFLFFLNDIAPVAALNARKMEELLFEDPASSIVKARLFAEEILNGIFKIEEIDAPFLSSLHEKISYLSREDLIERELKQSLDIIRLSGNKAAHNGNFNDITEAFKLHKEMYKVGVWFFESYSSDHQTKVPLYEIPKPKPQEDIKEIINKQLLELLGTGNFPIPTDEKNQDIKVVVEKSQRAPFEGTVEKEEAQHILNMDIEEGESFLLRELRRLKDSSQEAIENASQFSSFKDYLHVDRKIQMDLEAILERNKNRKEGNLILLCGSVGDGKSHLLAYLKEKKPELINHYKIYNDATESFSPNKNALETLEEVLVSFSDERINESEEKVILAINMGVLHNFINVQHKEYTYNKLKKFVEQSDLFSQNITTFYSNQYFDLLNFGDYHSYELTERGPKSYFYSSLLQRILNPSDKNPFYLALREDGNRRIHSMVHENYKFLQNEFVQEQVVQLIIQTIVKKKLVISARAFLNFVADILIPDELANINRLSEFDILNHSVPTLLFNRSERSTILFALSHIDPIHRRSIHIDELVIKLNTINDWKPILDGYVKDDTSKNWLAPFVSQNNLTDTSFNVFFESLLRITYLTNKQFAENTIEPGYLDFLKNLYFFNAGSRREIKGFYEEIKKAIFKWRGSPRREHLYLDRASDKYRLSQKLNLRPTIDHLKQNTNDVLESFKSSILLAYHDGNSENKIFLDIDFPLYSLLNKVIDGYRPNKKDEEDAIRFVEFIEKIMDFGEKKDNILVQFPKDNIFYVIKRDDFGAFIFERE